MCLSAGVAFRLSSAPTTVEEMSLPYVMYGFYAQMLHVRLHGAWDLRAHWTWSDKPHILRGARGIGRRPPRGMLVKEANEVVEGDRVRGRRPGVHVNFLDELDFRNLGFVRVACATGQCLRR